MVHTTAFALNVYQHQHYVRRERARRMTEPTGPRGHSERLLSLSKDEVRDDMLGTAISWGEVISVGYDSNGLVASVVCTVERDKAMPLPSSRSNDYEPVDNPRAVEFYHRIAAPFRDLS